MNTLFTKIITALSIVCVFVLGGRQGWGQNPNTLITYSTGTPCTSATSFCGGAVSGIHVQSTLQQYARVFDLNGFNTNNHDSVLIKNVRFSNTIIRNFDIVNDTFNYVVRIYKLTGAGYTFANRTLVATANSNRHVIPAGNGTLTGYFQQVYQEFTAPFNIRISAHDTIAIEVENPDFYTQGKLTVVYMGKRTETRQSSYVTAAVCGVYTTPSLLYPIIGAAYTTIGCNNIGFDIEANAEFFSTPVNTTWNRFKDTICAGAQNVVYSVNPSLHASTYDWSYSGGGVTINGNGSASVTLNVALTATSGILSVTPRNYYGHAATLTRYIQVDSIFAISLNLTNPVVCLGDTVTLSGPGGFTSYRWEPPTGLTSLNTSVTKASPANSHSYTLVVEDEYGCRGIGSTFVEINRGPVLHITPNPVSVCDDSVTVTISGADSYEWTPVAGIGDPNAASTKVRPASTTNYTIIATDGMGCTSETPLTVTVNNMSHVTITQNGRILSVPAGNGYLWYKDGQPVIPHAIFNQYNVKAPGRYKVLITDANGCQAFSEEIEIKALGIIDLNESVIKLYPNPTRDYIYIETALDINYEVFGIDGKLIFGKEDNKIVDMAGLASGMYYLVIEDRATANKASFKIVKSE